MTHEPNEPRWIRLAASLRAEPEPTTLTHVRARLAARVSADPSWLRWLARPVSLAMSAGLLVVSTVSGIAWVETRTARIAAEDSAMFTSVFVGDESSLGLPVSAQDATLDGITPADSQGAVR